MAAIAGTSTLSELANVALEVAQDMRTDGDPSDPCPPCNPQHRVGERQPRVPPAARRHEQGVGRPRLAALQAFEQHARGPLAQRDLPVPPALPPWPAPAYPLHGFGRGAGQAATRSPDPPVAGATAGSSGRGPWRSCG